MFIAWPALVLWVHATALKAETVTVSAGGYQADVGVHRPPQETFDAVVISLHGKERGRAHPDNVAYANRLARAGFLVLTPQMPWYDYSAPPETAFRLIDELVRRFATPAHKVFVAGHSQGAPYALFYSTAHTPPPPLSGVILLAPGHLIHRSAVIRKVTAQDVAEAREMAKAGKGQERRPFTDFNAGGGTNMKSVRTSAEIYLSYFDPETSLNFLEHIRQARVPVLWIDGTEDQVAKRMDYEGIFRTAKPHPANQYTTVRGGHVDMWARAAEPTLEWIRQFK